MNAKHLIHPLPCAGAVVLFCLSATVAPGQVEVARLTALDAAANDNFGASVAINGGRAIVGAWHEGLPTFSGAAYIFQQNGEFWDQQAKLVASDRASFDEFGISVGIAGNWAVVGAWTDIHLSISSGSIYIYQYNGTAWVQKQKLVASDRANSDGFGVAVAIDGETIVVGADQNFSGTTKSGVAYVYRYNGVNWTQQAKLTPLDGSAGDAFGRAVSISGDTVIIGAPNDEPIGFPSNHNSGSAYIYQRIGTLWTFQDKVAPGDGAAGDRTGLSVSVSGDSAVAGSPFNNAVGADSGAVYVFQRSGLFWSQQTKLTAADAAAARNFGDSVSINGDTIVAGSFMDLNQAGSAYVFQWNGSAWTQASKLLASDADDLQQFSRGAVALSSDKMLAVGSIANREWGTGAGAAYIFDLNATGAADSDNDGLSDADETALGTDPFNPDTDGDGVLDGLEVEIAAGTGCPNPLNADSDSDGFSDGHEIDFGPNPCNPDVDGDGLFDGAESTHGTNPNVADTDGDGVNDGAEIALGTNPLNSDSDGDGLSDGMEIAFSTNPLNPDTDGDGLTDGNEVALAGGSGCPNPLVADSDGDGLSDGAEHALGTNKCDGDSDQDGLSDSAESGYGTSPTNADSDGDGLPDGYEVALAAGSGCPSPTNPDSDGDGISDGDELTAGLGPCDTDSDNDGLSDGNESTYGTNPLVADTDGDGLLDGTEVDIAQGTGCPNPLGNDSDGDSLLDGDEIEAGTSPCNGDTDGDGLPDNVDPFPLSPGVPPDLVADITVAVAGEVQSLSVSAFLGPNDNARKGRQTALANNLHEAATAIRNGNPTAARASLMMVMNKIDSASPPADWMPASPQKWTLYSDVEAILILLDLMN